MQNSKSKKRDSTYGGARTHDHTVKSRALYLLSYTGHLYMNENFMVHDPTSIILTRHILILRQPV